ncbi:MAG: translation initiation factor IF-2 [Planctomycetes bacterium]|nr:translation initiation factor IF-2 [Planctomycetota bacterium]
MAKTETKTVPSGIKVSDLAKEFGITSKVLIVKAAELNIVVKSPSSFFTRGQADRLRAKFGGGAALREELEKKKTTIVKKPTGKKGTVAHIEHEPEAHEAPAAAVEEPAAPEVFVEAEEEPAPPAEEPAPEPEEPAPEPVAEPVVAEPIQEVAAPQVQEPAAEAPAEPQAPPRFIAAGPEIAPPVRRSAGPAGPAGAHDTRFGVVISADEAKKIHGDLPTRGGKKPAAAAAPKGPVQVEAKAVDDFKAQVSYPTLPPMAFESEEDRGGRGGAGGGTSVRRGPARGPAARKGMSSGPRRGRALMSENERYRKSHRGKQRHLQQQTIARTGPAEVTSPVTVKNLCESLGIKAADLIKKFFTEGKVVKINDILTDDDASLYASEFDPLKFGIVIKKARDVEEELLTKAEKPDKPEDLVERAPVVTIMGHVDHGKTSLLDYIRKTNVAAGEAGGITQHIRAYKVHRPSGDVVFLDTPGHKAFTEMRARGANVTDIVVLVVSAVDGVMPQTEEAISHARAANRRLVVAINKVDLPEANIERIKGQLAAKEVAVTGYGGDVEWEAVSAKTGKGVDQLLEKLVLEAEVMSLKANPEKPAIGTVVEAHKDPGRGIEATLLVQEGTLRSGDVIVCGHAYGTVRQILNDRGETIEDAGPATPVLLTGLNEVPLSGERFHVLDNIKQAAEIAEKRAMLMRQEGLSHRHHVTLENLHDMLAAGAAVSLKIILKVDVMGSLAPLENAIVELSTAEAKIEILHSGVGAINETDVTLADASDAIVIGFGVTADPTARRLAEERGVDLRTYEIIYEVVDEMRKALEGRLKPIEQESVQGHLQVRQTFKISKVGTVAGCFVIDGLVTRNSAVRLVREGKPVWTGKLDSLKRVKDDVREVREGFECGAKLDGYDDIKVGDIIESFTVTQVARTLDGAEKK